MGLILCRYKQKTKTKMEYQQKKFHLMYYIHISLYLLVIPSLHILPIPHTFTLFSQTPYGCQEAQLLPPPSPMLCFFLLPHVSLARDCFSHNRPLFFFVFPLRRIWPLYSPFALVYIWNNSAQSRAHVTLAKFSLP